VIHPEIPASMIPSLTVFTGLAVFRALHTIPVPDLSIKWPNDILAGSRKISGVLCESLELRGQNIVVAGIGVNIEGDETQYPTELAGKISTIERETGRFIPPYALMEMILAELDQIMDMVHSGCSVQLIREWEEHSSSIGRKVKFTDSGRHDTGIIQGLDEKGRLMVETAHQKTRCIVSGEIIPN